MTPKISESNKRDNLVALLGLSTFFPPRLEKQKLEEQPLERNTKRDVILEDIFS